MKIDDCMIVAKEVAVGLGDHGPSTMTCECYVGLLKWDFSAFILAGEISERDVALKYTPLIVQLNRE